MGLGSPNDVKVLMGWNQVVEIDDGSGYQPLRVTDYEFGTNQTGDAPDYVTGRQDRTAWTKGPVEVQGSLSYPLTFEQTGTFSGERMFKEFGAELALDIQETFGMRASPSESIAGCKVASTTISCSAGNPVECNATVWGIVDSTTNVSGESNTQLPDYFTQDTNTSSGVDVDNTYQLVQVPMWDTILVDGAPAGMLVTGFSVEIDNQLQRNYTMGNDSVRSPWGLNATSISAGQRRITGTVTWQSNDEGLLSFIMGVGIDRLVINVNSHNAGFVMTMNNVLWSAKPPRLSTGDRITVESNFIALGTGTTAFDALVIT